MFQIIYVGKQGFSLAVDSLDEPIVGVASSVPVEEVPGKATHRGAMYRAEPHS